MEEVLVGEFGCGVCIRELAGCGDVHVEECVVEVECRIIERGFEDKGGVERADCERG